MAKKSFATSAEDLINRKFFNMYLNAASLRDDEAGAARALKGSADMEYLSLAEIAYKKIKDAILKHEIVPGESLLDDELVLRLRVSQAPIRAALARMVQEGYVSQITNRGYRVNEMTAEEVVELFELRQLLEAHAIDEAIQRITPEGIDALEVSVKSSRKAIVTNRPLVDRYLINKDFHLIVAEIAGNGAVCRILQDTCEKLGLKRRIEDDYHGDFVVLRHHRDILRAIKNQDANKARESMRAHLDELKYTLLKQIALRTREAQAR
jgi:DNA-binding GntR family transcriptional regulator